MWPFLGLKRWTMTFQVLQVGRNLFPSKSPLLFKLPFVLGRKCDALNWLNTCWSFASRSGLDAWLAIAIFSLMNFLLQISFLLNILPCSDLKIIIHFRLPENNLIWIDLALYMYVWVLTVFFLYFLIIFLYSEFLRSFWHQRIYYATLGSQKHKSLPHYWPVM